MNAQTRHPLLHFCGGGLQRRFHVTERVTRGKARKLDGHKHKLAMRNNWEKLRSVGLGLALAQEEISGCLCKPSSKAHEAHTGCWGH